MAEFDSRNATDPSGNEGDADRGMSGSARAKALPLLPVVPSAVPELIPARMINEVLYCERLMYLEWVQAEWADNRYTVEGSVVHRRVDKRDEVMKVADGGAVGTRAKKLRLGESEGEPASDDKPYTARSVWLSSERLGVTAKVDVVEVEGDRVVPVEYKRGKEPKLGPYLPERAQVAVQVLLLREHGYKCEGGEIYFAAERRRVPIVVDEQLESTVVRAVERAREIAESGVCPPPLEDSPKCLGCSLAEICLPDEVRALSSLDPREYVDQSALQVGDDPWGLAGPEPDPVYDQRIRRLFPARDDKVPVYVQGKGAQVRLAGERLVVNVPGEKPREVRVNNTTSVTLYGNVQVTTQALRRLMDEGVPVLFASSGGWLTGRALGNDSKNVELRSAQYKAASDTGFCLNIASEIVRTKIHNSRTLLRRNHTGNANVTLSELKQLGRKVDDVESVASLLGIEGTAARSYFGEFVGMIKVEHDGFDFERRNRRPPKDPINALLSFCYSLLTREATMAVQSVGLDPLLGFYHQPRFGRASLALDLMEEFRPVLADSTVISVINNGVVNDSDFVRGQGAVNLTAPARKRVIQAMERRMDQLVTHPIFDYRLSYRRVLEIQARLLSRVLLGELKAYTGFRVR